MAQAKKPFKTAYEGHEPSRLICQDSSLTKQAMKKECDVNNIVAKYQRTGILDFVNSAPPQYGDTTGIDYRESLVKVAETEAMFADLPSKVRDYFENDPAKFLDFVKSDRPLEEINDALRETAKPVEDQKPERLPEVVEPAPSEPA